MVETRSYSGGVTSAEKLSRYTPTEVLRDVTIRRLAKLKSAQEFLAALEERAGQIASETSALRKARPSSPFPVSAMHSPYKTPSAARPTHITAAVGGSRPPTSPDMLSAQVSELKAYLQSVHDSDMMGSPSLQHLTASHAVEFAVKLLNQLVEAARNTNKAAVCGVMELAAATLLMFSQRESCWELLREKGALQTCIQLLSPLYTSQVVQSATGVVGNVARDVDCRLAFRAAGGVGALVRLLRPDCDKIMQLCAITGLSLLATRDAVVQDSVRYLGGLELLCNILAEEDVHLGEVARFCLKSLRLHNPKNEADIIRLLKAAPALVKDYRRLERAEELMRPQQDKGGADRPGSAPVRGWSSRARLWHRDSDEDESSPTTETYRISSSHAVKGATSPITAKTLQFDSDLDDEASDDSSLIGTLPRPPTPSSPSAFLPFSPIPKVSPTLAYARMSERASLRNKHILRMSSAELCALLLDLGLDETACHSIRSRDLSGAAFMALREEELEMRLLLPRDMVRKVQRLHAAVSLFDRMATLPRQGHLSEVEVKLHLAASGAPPSEMSKLVQLMKTLVSNGTADDSHISFWDFVTGYNWLKQAFKIYNMTV